MKDGLILVGAPGSGKGTQGQLLVEHLGYQKMSTGDLLRKEIKSGSKLGLRVQDIVASGNLVSDDIVAELIENEIVRLGDTRLYFDGYPRNLAQAKKLGEILSQKNPVKAVINFEVPSEVLVKRAVGRRVCGQCERIYHLQFNPPKNGNFCDFCDVELTHRSDDKEEKVRHRLVVYETETKPILTHYHELGLLKTLDASADKDQVFTKVREIIEL